MARIATLEHKWQDAADLSDKVIKLNPYYSPELHLYNAVAHLNLNNMSLAEERAKEAAQMDTNHRYPKINQLLGFIASQKQDYQEAASNLRLYVKFAPQANDIDQAKQQLADLEKLLGAAAANGTQTQQTPAQQQPQR
jgi:tetratricopeptide (TPR) repeat protein